MPHAAGSREVSEVITGAHITTKGMLLATDRYTVGQYTPPTVDIDGGFEGATVPIEAVKFVAKMRATQLGMGKNMAHEYAVRLIFQPEILNFRIELGYVSADQWNMESSATFTQITGNYPPVARLFPDESTEFGIERPLRLNTAFLARIQTATKWLGSDATAVFRFVHSDNPNKPGPVYVEVGGSFKALIQPNMSVR
jgi:hypothetical protein